MVTENFKLPQVDIPENMIHLGLGQPSGSLLPLDQIRKAAVHSFSGGNPFFLAYGKEQGNTNFRETLAQFLAEQYDYPVSTDQLLITNGNSHALDFICTHFTKPGDTVLVEEPSYFLALKIFADRKLDIVGIPIDDQGLNPAELKKQVEIHKPSFVYTIPAYHNPASVILSYERRKELVSICFENDLLLVADEVYHFLSHEKEIPPSIGYWADKCPLISIGSFSKIAAPGLRLGWIHSNPEIINKLGNAGVLESGGGFNPFTSEIVNSLILSGALTENIDKLKNIFMKRCHTLAKQISAKITENVVFTKPAGGYFIWMKLPNYINTMKLRRTAQKNNVDFFPGSLFSAQNGLTNYIRLSFSFYPSEVLEEGANRLCETIEDYLGGT